jgi:hypothetical protein
MATGYTYDVVKGKMTSRNKFILRCARAFIVCLRDEPIDVLIPKSFPPDTFHLGEMVKAKRTLKRLQNMTPAQRIAFGKKHLKKLKSNIYKMRDSFAVENDRVDDMLRKVITWKAPPEHENLKKFMEEQLTSSKEKFDWKKQIAELDGITPLSYYQEALKDAQDDVEYHKRHVADDVAEAEKLTEWVNNLRKSLNA